MSRNNTPVIVMREKIKQRNPFKFYETNPSCRVQGKTVVTARGQAYLEPGREMASRATTPIPTDFFLTDRPTSLKGQSSQFSNTHTIQYLMKAHETIINVTL